MKIYMVRTTSGRYCVFSETIMNKYNIKTEEEALNEFYSDRTFNPFDARRSEYKTNIDCTKIQFYNGDLFGIIIYEILSPNDTSTYEYW